MSECTIVMDARSVCVVIQSPVNHSLFRQVGFHGPMRGGLGVARGIGFDEQFVRGQVLPPEVVVMSTRGRGRTNLRIFVSV